MASWFAKVRAGLATSEATSATTSARGDVGGFGTKGIVSSLSSLSSDFASPRDAGAAASARGASSLRGGGGRGRRPTRRNILRELRPPEDTGTLARLRAKLLPIKEKEFEDEEIDTSDEEDGLKDVAEELCLTLEPLVEELGDPVNLALKKAGKLDPQDEDTIQRYKRHKVTVGKTLFTAENANNFGCECFRVGDFSGATAYFEKALELCSKERKLAQNEIADLKNFIEERFDNDVQRFFAALSAGEWRLALGRRRFTTLMRGMDYNGDAERLFELMDHGAGMTDGKVTMDELTGVLRAKPAKLMSMDGDVLYKGLVLNNLAACMIQKGTPAAALQKLRAAFKIVERRTERADDPMLQRVLMNLAIAYIYLNDYDAALNYLPSILESCEGAQGDLCQDVLTALYLIGYCFLIKANRFDIIYDRKRMDAGAQENPVEVNYSLALCSFKERMRRQYSKLDQIRRERKPVQGAEEQMRLEIAMSHEIIAEIHSQRREWSRALPHLKKAVAHKETIFMSGDPELLSVWNTLAFTLVRLRMFEEALALMEKAVAAAVTLFGEVSMGAASETYYMGVVLFKLGAEQSKEDKHTSGATFDMAIEKLLEVVGMQNELLNDEDPLVADTAQLLGSVHMAAGNRSAARRSFEKALLIRVHSLGRTHSATASSAHALGCVYARAPRRQEEAIQLLRKAVHVRERRLGPDSAALGDSLHELGSALLRRRTRRDHEAALQHLSRAAQIRDRTAGKESLKYAASMHQVGQAHAHLGLWSEAKLYLQAAVALREKLAGKKCAQTAMSRFALGVAALNLGDIPLAMKCVKASLAVRQEFFGLNHAHCADCLHQLGMVFVKKGELRAALGYMQRALDIRMKLNNEEAEARQDDSDEDQQDLVRRTSARERRIKKKRRRRAREMSEQRRQKAMDDDKARSERRHEEEESKASEDQAPKASARRGATFGNILSRLSLRSKFFMGGDMSHRSSEESHASDSARSEASATASDGGASEGTGAVPKAPPAADRKRGSRSGTAASTGAAGADVVAAGGAAAADGDSDRSDELTLEQVGVDVRGYLVGVIANSMQALASVHMDLEEFRHSKVFLARAACLQEEVFGQVSPEYGECLHMHGLLYQRMGDLVASLRHFRDALRIREKACGYVHESTAFTCIEIGDVLVQLGQAEDAGIYLLRGLNIRESAFGPNDHVVRSLKDRWGNLMAAELQYDPVRHGEELPHFARRSPESFLHGFDDRVAARSLLRVEDARTRPSRPTKTGLAGSSSP